MRSESRDIEIPNIDSDVHKKESFTITYSPDAVLHSAIVYYSATAKQVEKLVSLMSSVIADKKDELGKTAFLYIALSGNLDNIKLVINKSAYHSVLESVTTESGNNFFNCVAFSGNVGAIKAVIKKFPEKLNTVDQKGRGFLHHIARSGNIDSIRYVLSSDCPITLHQFIPHRKDSGGLNFFDHIVLSNNSATVQFFIKTYPELAKQLWHTSPGNDFDGLDMETAIGIRKFKALERVMKDVVARKLQGKQTDEDDRLCGVFPKIYELIAMESPLLQQAILAAASRFEAESETKADTALLASFPDVAESIIAHQCDEQGRTAFHHMILKYNEAEMRKFLLSTPDFAVAMWSIEDNDHKTPLTLFKSLKINAKSPAVILKEELSAALDRLAVHQNTQQDNKILEGYAGMQSNFLAALFLQKFFKDDATLVRILLHAKDAGSEDLALINQAKEFCKKVSEEDDTVLGDLAESVLERLNEIDVPRHTLSEVVSRGNSKKGGEAKEQQPQPRMPGSDSFS